MDEYRKTEELARVKELAARVRDAERALQEAVAARDAGVVRAIKADATVREIGEIIGLSHGTIGNIYRRRGGPKRKPGRRPRKSAAPGADA